MFIRPNENTTVVIFPSWPWSYGSWIYNYLCNQYLSPLTLWVRIPLRRGVLDTTLCDKVCQWLATGRWFSPSTPVSSTNTTNSHNNWNIVKSGVKPNTPNPWSHFPTQVYSPLEIIRMGENIEKLDGERVSSASTVLAAMLINHLWTCTWC